MIIIVILTIIMITTKTIRSIMLTSISILVALLMILTATKLASGQASKIETQHMVIERGIVIVSIIISSTTTE